MTVDAAVNTRADAAKARAAALGGEGGNAQRATPQETGRARMLPTPAQLRAKLETRGDQEYYHLEGIASVTDKAYRMWDVFGEYDEVVTRGAFTDTLAANPDVAFLLNHKGLTMARTSAGTLQLAMADEGLKSDAWLNPKRQDVKDLILAIEDRSITEMSFAFMLDQGEWSEDFQTFRITKLDINRGDVSAVNYGANPYTSIAARSREIFSDLERLPTGAARAALDQLAARQDLVAATPEPQPEPAPEASISFYEALLNLT
jgi:HK97 family phage prohead protease